MDDVQPALLTETISPNKRKKASIKQKDGVLGAAREAKKVVRKQRRLYVIHTSLDFGI
jgi:hypothetical protein